MTEIEICEQNVTFPPVYNNIEQKKSQFQRQKCGIGLPISQKCHIFLLFFVISTKCQLWLTSFSHVNQRYRNS
jgi:hypothetical protein